MRISTRLRSALSALVLAAPFAACTSFDSVDEVNQANGAGGGSDAGSSDGDGQCAFTQGYWKNHPESWPVTSLMLGSTSYTQAELLRIFGLSVQGNGLVSLAHQLIAAKLNVAAGADDGDIADDIAAADQMIGSLIVPPIGAGHLSTSQTSALNDALDGFNNSKLSGADCNDEPACGDGHLDAGEQCDDGNTMNGDGCSAMCQPEPPPPPPPACGDGHLDAGEQCDDGNATNGDGCSAMCRTEPPPPPPPSCGDDHLDAGEQCDDGNTTNGDGCSATCMLEHEPFCGDGRLDAGEACDDGNTASGDGCSPACMLEPVCEDYDKV